MFGGVPAEMVKIFIYRPDKANRNINWSGVYHVSGQSWLEYDRDRDEAYQYKVELLKKELSRKHKTYLEDYWR